MIYILYFTWNYSRSKYCNYIFILFNRKCTKRKYRALEHVEFVMTNKNIIFSKLKEAINRQNTWCTHNCIIRYIYLSFVYIVRVHFDWLLPRTNKVLCLTRMLPILYVGEKLIRRTELRSLLRCCTTCFAIRTKRITLNLAEAARTNGKQQMYVRCIDNSESGLFLVLVLYMEVYL